MHVLVAGSGLVAGATVDALLERGHTVRLLAPNSEAEARHWPRGVEAHVADLWTGRGVAEAASGCDAVVALFAHARRDATAASRGAALASRRVVREAERAGVQRVVLLSALEAGPPHSSEHRSREKAESALRGARVQGVIVRASLVYGPDEGALALLLRLVRTLPAVPLPEGGRHLVQPIWYEDLGKALAIAGERADLDGRVLEVAGPDRASLAEIVDELAMLTGRSPRRLPIPGSLASAASDAVRTLGVRMPLSEAERALLLHEVVLPAGRVNALSAVLGVTPTPLRDGLRRLAGSGPEQPPSKRSDAVKRRRRPAAAARGKSSPARARTRPRSSRRAPRRSTGR